MIPKSGNRFSEKHALGLDPWDHAQTKTRRRPMAKITRINPNTISKPFTNYAHVVTVEGAQKLVFCAGQVAADVDGRVLPPDDFEAQTKMVMKNLENALAAGAAKLSHV